MDLTTARERPAELVDVPIVFRAQVEVALDEGRVRVRARARDATEDSPATSLRVHPGTRAEERAQRLARGATPDAPWTLCIVHAVVRDRDTGPRELELLRLTAPDDPLTPEEAAALGRALVFLDRNNPQAARRRLRVLLDAREHDPPVRTRMLMALARACMGTLDQEGATKALEGVLAVDPGHEEAAELLAGLVERPLKSPGTAPGRAGTTIPLPSGPELEPPGGREEREEPDGEPDPPSETDPPEEPAPDTPPGEDAPHDAPVGHNAAPSPNQETAFA